MYLSVPPLCQPSFEVHQLVLTAVVPVDLGGGLYALTHSVSQTPSKFLWPQTEVNVLGFSNTIDSWRKVRRAEVAQAFARPAGYSLDQTVEVIFGECADASVGLITTKQEVKVKQLAEFEGHESDLMYCARNRGFESHISTELVKTCFDSQQRHMGLFGGGSKGLSRIALSFRGHGCASARTGFVECVGVSEI